MAKQAASGKKAKGAAGGSGSPVTQARAPAEGPRNPTLPEGKAEKAGLPSDDRRAYATQALADLVPGLTRAAYKRRSPAASLLMSEWSSIVGPRLAMETAPKKFVGGTLTIACSGAMAMELQHLSAAVIERINAHAGHQLVQRLRFVQEPVAAPAPPLQRRIVAPVPLTELPPGELNDALARLRAALASK
jgi:hypothetical protein